MYSVLFRPTAARFPSTNIIIFAGLFWIFTFAALSARTEMILGEAFHLFTVRRVLGTTVGAFAFAMVLDCIARRAREGVLNPASAIAAILPASLIVLGARLAIDQIFYDFPLPFETNLKWVAVWAGYFGMWVSAALAFQMHRQNERAGTACRQAVGAGTAPPARKSECRNFPMAPAELSTWEWVADAFASELAALPQPHREAVVARLMARAGYEVADCEFEVPAGEQQMRMALARRISARLSNT